MEKNVLEIYEGTYSSYNRPVIKFSKVIKGEPENWHTDFYELYILRKKNGFDEFMDYIRGYIDNPEWEVKFVKERTT